MEIVKNSHVIYMDMKVEVHQKHLLEFLQIALAVVKDGKKEEGCYEYVLHRDMEDSNVFHFETRWKSMAELDVHVRSQNFGALLGAMLFLTDTHEIKISTLSYTGGGEYINEIRNQRIIS